MKVKQIFNKTLNDQAAIPILVNLIVRISCPYLNIIIYPFQQLLGSFFKTLTRAVLH